MHKKEEISVKTDTSSLFYIQDRQTPPATGQTLSEMSVARGGAVVDIPDFTNGKWVMGLDTAGER